MKVWNFVRIKLSECFNLQIFDKGDTLFFYHWCQCFQNQYTCNYCVNAFVQYAILKLNTKVQTSEVFWNYNCIYACTEVPHFIFYSIPSPRRTNLFMQLKCLDKKFFMNRECDFGIVRIVCSPKRRSR